ncbi:hypothetical protein [Achromobacter animicus]|uniref:hypothetical protein n=1 Tax=Achromobacter animicus TaxID=1389935 RepID=UPI0028A5E044|nr:hypothetical protein [Achromobacter animicus]
MNKALPRPNLDEARLYLEIMEEQKERTRALLNVILDTVKTLGISDLTTLVSLAADVNEDHAHWYSLQECLGIKDAKKCEGAA